VKFTFSKNDSKSLVVLPIVKDNNFVIGTVTFPPGTLPPGASIQIKQSLLELPETNNNEEDCSNSAKSKVPESKRAKVTGLN
jgi:hypothetical protein